MPNKWKMRKNPFFKGYEWSMWAKKWKLKGNIDLTLREYWKQEGQSKTANSLSNEFV